MKKFFRGFIRLWPYISFILIAVLFLLDSLSFFQAMVLLVLMQISVQLERLAVYQETIRQYNEYLIRASQLQRKV